MRVTRGGESGSEPFSSSERNETSDAIKSRNLWPRTFSMFLFSFSNIEAEIEPRHHYRCGYRSQFKSSQKIIWYQCTDNIVVITHSSALKHVVFRPKRPYAAAQPLLSLWGRNSDIRLTSRWLGADNTNQKLTERKITRPLFLVVMTASSAWERKDKHYSGIIILYIYM